MDGKGVQSSAVLEAELFDSLEERPHASSESDEMCWLK